VFPPLIAMALSILAEWVHLYTDSNLSTTCSKHRLHVGNVGYHAYNLGWLGVHLVDKMGCSSYDDGPSNKRNNLNVYRDSVMKIQAKIFAI